MTPTIHRCRICDKPFFPLDRNQPRGTDPFGNPDPEKTIDYDACPACNKVARENSYLKP